MAKKQTFGDKAAGKASNSKNRVKLIKSSFSEN